MLYKSKTKRIKQPVTIEYRRKSAPPDFYLIIFSQNCEFCKSFTGFQEKSNMIIP